MSRYLAIILLLGFCIAPFIQAQNTNLEKGIYYYDHRADGAVGLAPKPENLNKAFEFLEKAFEDGEEETAGEYLLRSYNYLGRFMKKSKSEKIGTFEKGMRLGEGLVKKYPKSVGIRFEYICLLGLWGDNSGIMKAAKEGVIGKMKDHTDALVAMDSHHFYASPYRILGILHLKAPHIPFVLTWPDIDLARSNLESALQVSPNDFGNQFYYAEVLLEDGEDEKAKGILQRILKLKPRPNLLIEDKVYQQDAKKLLDDQ